MSGNQQTQAGNGNLRKLGATSDNKAGWSYVVKRGPMSVYTLIVLRAGHMSSS